MILRTVFCAVCKNRQTEKAEGAGFPEWGQLRGVNFNKQGEPHLCPRCLTDTANFLDERANEKRPGSSDEEQ